MTDGKNKNIVEEVFGRSMKGDDRVSALFSCIEQPPQAPLETAEDRPSDSNGSLPGNEQFQSAKDANHESISKGINKKSTHHAGTIAAVGLLLFGSIFFAGRYIIQDGNASTEMMPKKQYVNDSETVSPPERLLLPDAQPEIIESGNVEPEDIEPESVLEEINKSSTVLDWQPVINWSRLLSEISDTIPKTMHLSVIESSDGSEMFLEGEALSADAIYSFVDSLNKNRQVKSAELAETGIGQGDSQELLTFSISCSLVSETKSPGSVDGDHNNSGLDRNKFFTPGEAEEFFGSINSVSEHAGCLVESFFLSPKDAVFDHAKTSSSITKEHAVLTLLGSYQNILKATQELQDHPQGVWFDSISIRQGSETGGLECSMGISVYVAKGAG